MSNKGKEQGAGDPCCVLGVLTGDPSRHEGCEAVGRGSGSERERGNLGTCIGTGG